MSAVTPESPESAVHEGDPHRRRASHLYGLIISGAVLATAPSDFTLAHVAWVLLATLCIYWIAETYVHMMAARTVHRRDLTAPERRAIVLDGWPLVAASAVPLAALTLEAIFRVDTAAALDITLAINSVMLFAIGWQMSRASGLRGVRLVLSATVAGLLGLLMIALKTLMHH